MNSLLEGDGRMTFYTDLALVFRALGERPREFNWLITDLDCLPRPVEALARRQVTEAGGDAWWFSGDELMQLVDSQKIQFIWAVLSGFAAGTLPQLSPLIVYPLADGNGELWSPGVHIQHPQVDVEIVCWDSGATLLQTRDHDLSQRFRSYFPEAVDLDAYNAKTAKRLGRGARDSDRP